MVVGILDLVPRVLPRPRPAADVDIRGRGGEKAGRLRFIVPGHEVVWISTFKPYQLILYECHMESSKITSRVCASS